MKEIGIFICNYNKRDYVINCVKSVLEQSFTDFDLFVVDNGSTDDSVSKLKEIYGDKINVIKISKNVGASAGINTGLRKGYEVGYKYIMSLDNDTVLDKDAVFELYNALSNDENAGMANSKILQLLTPEKIQEYGAKISFDNYNIEAVERNKNVSNSSDEIQERDTISTCAVMIKREVIEKIGFLDEEIFIYWDDIDFGYRCTLSGYKCLVVGSSKVWHNSSWLVIKNLGFNKYYFWRNRLYFFAKYVSENDIEKYAKSILSEFYRNLIGFYCKEQYDLLPVYMYALNDFLYNVRGKAEEHKYKRTLENNEPFTQLLLDSKEILIKVPKEKGIITEEIFCIFIQNCLRINPKLKIFTYPDYWNEEEKERLKAEIDISFDVKEKYDNIFYFCEHVEKEKKCILPEILVDKYCNCINSNKVYNIYRNIEENCKFFIDAYKDVFIRSVKKLKENTSMI